MWKEWLLDLFFPPKCIFCGKLLSREERHYCLACRDKLPETDRRKAVRLTTGCVAPFLYQELVRDALLRFKFGSRPYYAEAFGPMIAAKLQNCEADFVTWIPVSGRRKFARGYDQAQLLAEEVAKSLQLSCISTMKKHHRKKQSRMRSPAERRANIAGAFTVKHPEQVAGKVILLIDDICTTGATMSEAALMLSTAGAKQIHGAVLAMTEETKNSR